MLANNPFDRTRLAMHISGQSGVIVKINIKRTNFLAHAIARSRVRWALCRASFCQHNLNGVAMKYSWNWNCRVQRTSRNDFIGMKHPARFKHILKRVYPYLR